MLQPFHVVSSPRVFSTTNSNSSSKMSQPKMIPLRNSFKWKIQILPGLQILVTNSKIPWKSQTIMESRETGKMSNGLIWLMVSNIWFFCLSFSSIERFIVWMRTSGLPTFRKLWGRIENALPPPADGKKYYVRVYNHFELVTDGKKNQKKFVISTMNSLGGKNFFLAYCFFVMGLFCVLISVIFCGAHMKKNSGVS